jgi:hypothetical protein
MAGEICSPENEKNHPDFLPIIKPQHFNQLYYQLYSMTTSLRFQDDASKANKENDQLEINKEKELNDWLCSYEKLADKIHPIIETNLNREENPDEFESSFISVDADYNVKIAVSDYKEVMNFLDNFYEHFWDVVKKNDGLKDSTYDPDEDELGEMKEGKGLREMINEWENNSTSL